MRMRQVFKAWVPEIVYVFPESMRRSAEGRFTALGSPQL